MLLACVIVDIRLDYCNTLLTKMPEANFNKLQIVQNTFARVTTGANRRDDITPVLAKLLPIRERVTFKMGALVGRSALSYCTIRTWNNLPADIRKSLKFRNR